MRREERPMRRLAACLLMLALAVPATCATKLIVTVIDKKSGEPVTNLTANDFTVTAGHREHQVKQCAFQTGRIDVILLLDSSLIGPTISSVAPTLVNRLGAKEQMAIVAYASSADLIQEFTSSKALLRRALAGVNYGNSPRLLDALYATIEDGFADSLYRRVILLLTTGVDGPSRVSVKEVIGAARHNEVSIFPVYAMGYGRSRLEKLARETGGAAFNLRKMSRNKGPAPPVHIFRAMHGHYTLTLSGDLPLGDTLEVRLRRKNKKLLVSCLELN